jgi:hypothetical protein
MGSKLLIQRILLYVGAFLYSVGLLQGGVTGKIAGQITDSQTGEPIPGADIVFTEIYRDGEMTKLDEASVMGTSTDRDGYYFIINIPPGLYTVEVLYMGYHPLVKTGVRIRADFTTRLDEQITPTILDAGIETIVTAEREMIRTDLTASSVTVGADEIEALPVREVNDVISLEAGVVEDASGALHIRGGRSNEIAYFIDGVRITDPLNRNAGITVDNQAVQEVQTISGTFNAEYGQAMSGIINIVTKRGSDKFTLNATGYLGDYFSLNDDVYYVMNNENWAQSAAYALTRDGYPLLYDFFNTDGYPPSSPAIQDQKVHLTKEGYLGSYNPITHRDFQANVSGPIPYSRNRISYFASFRYQYDPSYTHGRRYFMPWGFQAPVLDPAPAI